jgi:hypothetical protein
LAPFFTKIQNPMSTYFSLTASFLRQAENGLIKKTNEEYLIDAVSFGEAEARAIAEASSDAREFTVNKVAKSPIKEVVFYGDTDLWCKCKVTYSLMDEDSEKESKITTYILVNAKDTKEAYDRCCEHLKEMLVPFEIPKVEETKIVDIYQYEKQAPAGYVKRDRQQVMDKTDKRVQQLVNAGGMAIGVTGMLRNRTGHEMPMQFAVDATDEQWDAFIDGDEADVDCAFEGDSVEAHYTKTPTEYITNPKAGLIDPTDGQAVAFNAMTLETYLEDIRPNYTADVIDSIRSAYKRHSEDLFLMQLSLMAFTRPQREMIADLCNNE